MRVFGLHPEDVLARSGAADWRRDGTLAGAMVYGALSFGAVSVLAYSVWAYRLIHHELALYATVAAIYIGLTGLGLSRLVGGRGTAPRFALLFAVAFLAYALAWCACWFGLHGKHQADLWGTALGLAAMTLLLQRAFGATGGFLRAFAVLFLAHTVGYYAGEALYAAVGHSAGRLLWGALHGLGFGAGLGCVLHRCQAPLKIRLRSAR